METWYPPKDRPQLFEWWRPLILASRATRLERFPWPINIDEMILVGRIDRSSRPSIWVYRHPQAGGEIYLDSTGQAYKFTRTPNGRGFGRFTACEIRTALWRSGIPEVVEPIWYEQVQPPGSAWPPTTIHDDPDDGEESPEAAAPAQPEPEPAAHPFGGREPRRRGHLTVIDGGRPLAG